MQEATSYWNDFRKCLTFLLRSDPFCDPKWTYSLFVSCLWIGYSDESGFSFRPSSSRGRIAIYLSIHIRINKCGSRDRSIAPHQQLEEEKGMMSRPGLGTYQPTIPFWNGKKKGWSTITDVEFTKKIICERIVRLWVPGVDGMENEWNRIVWQNRMIGKVLRLPLVWVTSEIEPLGEKKQDRKSVV